jgi:hypothetical protein
MSAPDPADIRRSLASVYTDKIKKLRGVAAKVQSIRLLPVQQLHEMEIVQR